MADELLVTVKESGGDYSNLEAALNANEKDLTSSDEWLHIEISGAFVFADTNRVVLHNYTTDVDHYILIEAIGSARHDGKYVSNAYRLEFSQGGISMFDINNGFVIVDGIQISNTGGSGGACIEPKGTDPVTIKNCIIRSAGSATNVKGIHCDNTPTGSEIWLINNIIYDCGGYGIYWDYGNRTDGACYNNTIHNCGHDASQTGIRIFGTAGSNNWYIINNIGNSNYIDMIIGNAQGTADNATEDTSSPNDEWDNTVVDFEDEANDIFLLADTADVIDGGTDLSADGEFAFDYDILGTTRPTGAWDIGAHEFVSTSVPLDSKRQLPFEFKRSISLNKELPFEFLEKLETNRQLMFEILLSMSSNRQLPFELKEIINSNRLLPFEFKQSLEHDRQLPFEILLSMQSSRQLPFEFSITLNSNRQLSFEFNVAVVIDTQLPFEFKQSLDSKRQLPFESLIISEMTRPLPFEFSERSELNKSIPFEFKESLASKRQLPFEYTGIVLLTFNFQLPIEFKQSIETKKELPFEFKQRISLNKELPLEFLQSMQSNRSLAFEFLQSIISNRSVPFEFKQHLDSNRRLPFEWRLLFALSTQLPFEFVSKLESSRQLPFEWRSLFATNRELPVEFRSIFESNRQMPFEFGEELDPISRKLQFEILKSMESNRQLPMEWLGIALSSATVIDVEMITHIAKDIQLIYFDPKDVNMIIS